MTTQLAFLEPIPYEVIADKTTTEIRDMVVDKIQRKLDTMETMIVGNDIWIIILNGRSC